VEGVTSVSVDLEKGIALVEGTATEASIAAKVSSLGYELIH
jgi:copper chaperone CopZ